MAPSSNAKPTRRIIRSTEELQNMPPAQGSKYQQQCPMCKGSRYRTARNFMDEGEHREHCNVCKATGLLPCNWEQFTHDTVAILYSAEVALKTISETGDAKSRNIARLALLSIDTARKT